MRLNWDAPYIDNYEIDMESYDDYEMMKWLNEIAEQYEKDCDEDAADPNTDCPLSHDELLAFEKQRTEW